MDNSKILNIFLVIIAALSAGAAYWSAYSQSIMNRVELRPYISIKLTEGLLLLHEPGVITFPYVLENMGKTPALRINKGYKSYLNVIDDKNLIHPYREDESKSDALVPGQISAIHMDRILINGFDPNKQVLDKIIIVIDIQYLGFSEIDSRKYYSRANFILAPSRINGVIRFNVAQPFLDYGFVNGKSNKINIFGAIILVVFSLINLFVQLNRR